MITSLAIAAVVLAATSGLPGVALRARPAVAQRVACAWLCAGALAGSVAALLALASPVPAGLRLAWSVPGGSFALHLDALSAIFLLPILIVPALGAIDGLASFPQAALGGKAVRVQALLGIITAAMATLVLAANAVLFLVAWEVMALAGFLLVLTDHDAPEAQRAALVYLAATHTGTLALFALFALLGRLAGSFDFAAMAGLPAVGGAAAGAFALALAGFGVKAGLVPLHFWLPGAHAAAPSHVSALLSGVLLKTGIYGLVRVTGFFGPPPAAWGLTLLLVGAASAVLGVGFALAQHDLKRLLAYHSVENVGIIAMGLGLALLGRTLGDPVLVVLGLGGALLHVVNHATFKALLFLGAGAVVHATGTREIDHLGGLARRMPRTAALFLVGAAAISGLPPLNGFASEWLVSLASLHTVLDAGPGPSVHAAVLGVPVLGLVAGLAAACFAKVVGAVFLGQARTAACDHAHDPGPASLVPLAVLAAACVAIGLAPGAIVPALSAAAAGWSGMAASALAGPAAEAAASAARVSLVAGVLLALVGGLVLWRRRLLPGPVPRAEIWGCGYARPTPRMQYTGSSLAELLVLRFGWAFFPRARIVPPRGPFPRGAAFASSVPDTVLDVGIAPALAWLGALAGRARGRLLRSVQFQAFLLVLGVGGLLLWLAAAGAAP